MHFLVRFIVVAVFFFCFFFSASAFFAALAFASFAAVAAANSAGDFLVDDLAVLDLRTAATSTSLSSPAGESTLTHSSAVLDSGAFFLLLFFFFFFLAAAAASPSATTTASTSSPCFFSSSFSPPASPSSPSTPNSPNKSSNSFNFFFSNAFFSFLVMERCLCSSALSAFSSSSLAMRRDSSLAAFSEGVSLGGPLDASDSELEEEEADAMDSLSSSSILVGGAWSRDRSIMAVLTTLPEREGCV
mmetsp:Transcript_21347/g.39223  ORF Transcript_21347/g.39223 Transcript_21347/m.39223 type:complete len:245 (-) Transcript_21347:381-1115(-)